jgi:hypothetical protein
MEEITVVYKSIHPIMVCIMLGDQTASNTIVINSDWDIIGSLNISQKNYPGSWSSSKILMKCVVNLLFAGMWKPYGWYPGLLAILEKCLGFTKPT